MVQRDQTTTKEKRGIDWEAVHRRIAAAGNALENAGKVSDQDRERIWKERAIQFARKPEEDVSGSIVYLIIVKMGRELCAFDVSCIESIRPLEEVTRVPRSPEWITGITNLRGHIYSVTDLQNFLHLNGTQAQNKSQGEILVARSEKMRLALRVDEVRSVEMIQQGRLQPASETIQGVKPEFIQGVIEDYEMNGERVPVLVLNMEALLADESLIVHEEFV